MRTPMIRAAAAALGLMGAALAGDGARAQADYPYCAVAPGGYGAAFTSCGFTSLEQCRATVRGDGGWCIVNPSYPGGAAPADDAARSRRHLRHPGS